MKYEINLGKDFTGEYLGEKFLSGKAVTESGFRASQFQRKGYEVKPVGDEKFRCPYCDKEYKSDKSLKDHIKKEHPEAPEPPAEV